jgi:hypothetical protein
MSKPVNTLSIPTGKGARINASLWENEVEQENQSFTTYSVSIEKRYRDGETWKTAKSFKAHELLHVAYLATEAYKQALEQQQEHRSHQVV